MNYKMSEKLTITHFPDGQPNVAVNISKLEVDDFLTFRVNSPTDLIALASVGEVCSTHSKKICVTIPCLFGQRSDRRFAPLESFGMKVVANIINMCGFESVFLFDPHSDVGPALINNSFVMNGELTHVIGKCIKAEEDKQCGCTGKDNVVLVSPDAGAYKKVFKYAEIYGKELVAANKFRDNKGKVTLNFSGDVAGKDCLIIDDLCSRGNTFIKLAQKLKDQGAQTVQLYVSHFEGGCEEYKQTIDNLLKCIDRVYTTNSFRDFDEDDRRKILVQDVFQF
jgi:ribose-phosphate pyrophosphokinase